MRAGHRRHTRDRRNRTRFDRRRPGLSISESPRRLGRSELPIDTVALARYLIGKLLVHDSATGRLSGRIVETEAYIADDAASHAYRGITPRNRSMYLERGYAYVYRIYGTWYCLNVSSELPDIGAAVLLRALEPLEGIPMMQQQRGTTRLTDLTRGPGRLADAMQIDLRHDGLDLCGNGPLWLGVEPASHEAPSIRESVRIGLTREADRLLRFYEARSPFVSGPARLRV